MINYEFFWIYEQACEHTNDHIFISDAKKLRSTTRISCTNVNWKAEESKQ